MYLRLRIFSVVLWTVSLSLLAASSAWANNDCSNIDCAYNPEPAADDLVLPMPGNFQMVFRKVLIPGGAEFWGSPERLIKVGDIRGDSRERDIFESVQKLPIAGSFIQDQQWYYYLGKYEVTVGQYAVVMGDGDLVRGIQELGERGGDKKSLEEIKSASGIKRHRLLAEPIRFLGWYDYQDFIRRYNSWCLSDQICQANLPRLPARLQAGSPMDDDSPGFFRLPTDLEWEYAARGGLQTLTQRQDGTLLFENSLPFPSTEIKRYAWTRGNSQGRGPARIARVEPVNGFYDLFGNVQELTADLFRADFIQGKIGGFSARGGSFFDTDDPPLRVSQRVEVPIYQLQSGKLAEAKSGVTGIRLAIGSLVVQSEHYRNDLVASYRDYIEGFRKQTTAGLSLNDPFSQVADVTLQEAQNVLTVIAQTHGSDPQLQNQVAKIRAHLQLADRKIDEGITDVVDKMVSNALIVLKTAGWHSFRRDSINNLIAEIEAMQISGRSAQIAAQQKNLGVAEDGLTRNFEHYAQTVESLQTYPKNKVLDAIGRFAEAHAEDRPYIESCRLLQQHLNAPLNPQIWRKQLETMARTPGVYL